MVLTDRQIKPEDLIVLTGRKPLVELDVVALMPRGDGEWTEVHFFKPDNSAFNAEGVLTDQALDHEYVKRGLKPADMYSIVFVDKADPSLVLSYPYATHWKDVEGNWCHGAIVNFEGERRLHVNRSVRGWKQHWYFAGIPK
jgi:hypothetical protein